MLFSLLFFDLDLLNFFDSFFSFLVGNFMPISELEEEAREVFLDLSSCWCFFSIFIATFTTLSVFLIRDFFNFFISLLSGSSFISIVIRMASFFTFLVSLGFFT